MRTTAEIIKALEICSETNTCIRCPYHGGSGGCVKKLTRDSLELIRSLMDNGTPGPETAQEPTQAPEPWTREKVLAEAKRCVCGERDQSYGGPEDSFRLIAKLWEPYVREKMVPKGTPVDIEPEDVAIMMGMLKIARLASNPTHMDSWVDLAGYAACGGEIAGKEVQG